MPGPIQRGVPPEGPTQAPAAPGAPISAFRWRHPGQSCAILAPGPSLVHALGRRLEVGFEIALNDVLLARAHAYCVCIDTSWFSPEYQGGTMAQALQASAAAGRLFTSGPRRIGLSVPPYNPFDGEPYFSFDLETKGVVVRGCTLVALQLAVWMGAAEIFLVGVDLGAVGDRGHYRGDRPWSDRATFVQKRAMRGLWQLLRERGVEVWNCSPTSALEEFPYHALPT